MPTTIFDPGRGHRVPVVVWARDASRETIAQLERIACRSYAALRVAAMPDAHVGGGVAVGTVFATERTLVPRALGGDLGCGVSACRLSVAGSEIDPASWQRVVDALVRAIPAGDAVHRGRGIAVPDRLFESRLSTGALERSRDALARRHLATLGGGNHFLEIDRDAEDGLWLLVHSGSRGLGGAIAAHHVRAAEARDPDPLAGLDADTEEGRAYERDLSFALAFARHNRLALARRAIEIASDVLGREIEADEELDVHHNFIAHERWDDVDLFVHRKGAIAAPQGARVIVPGSMATASYFAEGLGCPLAFGSCSHGAGRVMTRREAHARVRSEALVRSMRRIAWPSHLARKLVEEAPHVYRDIGEVMDDQDDLVVRTRRVEPLAVLKG